MAGSRYVVLGLALARSAWFRTVGGWANAAAIPVEFVRCLSATEVHAHLAGGRVFSALLVDGAVATLDRDLVDRARSAGCTVVVVDDGRATRDWTAIGAAAVIGAGFDRRDLLDVLSRHAAPVDRADAVPGAMAAAAPSPAAWRARVAMVCGPGGTGASTVAIALAQGLADDVRYGGMVLLADLARNGEQAMLHDAQDVVPGVQELVDAHRTGTPTVETVRSLVFAVVERRYDLLIGLRRSHGWSALRPRAFAAALDSLTRGWRVVVADTDADLEGEDDGGSIDVEERNVMARSVAARADVAVVVGGPGMKGTHALARVVTDVVSHGVSPERVLAVVSRAPRSERARASQARALADLTAPTGALASPLFLPERRVDDALRDGARLQASLSDPLANAFHAVLDRAGGARAVASPAVPVPPGSLASWSTDVETA